MKEEYGGYLPFEGHIEKDFFSVYGEENVIRTNSGKAAIYYALKMMDIHSIHVPYYFCGSVFKMIQNTGISIKRYYLDEHLCPVLDNIGEDEGIILVNYFGCMNKRIKEILDRYKNIIIDQTHSFFSAPVFREDIFNVYSCRKFFGVPDGGFLVGMNLKDIQLKQCKISDHFLYLVKSFEYGTNSSYQEKLQSDSFFMDNYCAMSNLTRTMLSSIDYQYIADKRKKNFEALHKKMSKYNIFKLEEPEDPLYLYPFLPSENIKRALIDRKIYVPAIWRELVCQDFYGTIEYEMSEKGVFLPVDQRYDIEDMEYIADIVIGLL